MRRGRPGAEEKAAEAKINANFNIDFIFIQVVCFMFPFVKLIDN